MTTQQTIDIERRRRHQGAIDKSSEIWNGAQEAPADHPYLLENAEQPHDLYQYSRPPKLPLGHSRCRCEACGHHFNSGSVFDRHRVGDWKLRGANRRCLEPKEMLRRGWQRNAKGFWVERKRPRQRLDLPPVGGLRAEVTLTPGGTT
jgi:hypothetical protein